MAAHQFYEFGPYRLELPTRRLLRNGAPVSLTPKAFDTLLALVERRNRVVDKSELMKLLWPDAFVEEANLSQTVFVLRKLLGEGPGGRQYIDTIPRRGYRFAAEATEDGVAPGAVSDTTRPRATARWPTSRTAMLGLVVAAVMVAAVAGVWRWTNGRPRSATDSLAGKTRIVVLPFENLTRDPADDWLAGAFSDSLTLELQNLNELIVVSRDRLVELYNQRAVKEAAVADPQMLRTLSQTLTVRYYVHGSYQRLGDQIRVAARLVESDSGEIKAQESVTDSFANILKLEDDLARKFAARLETGSETASARTATLSIVAYQAFIEARGLYAAGRLEAAQKRLEDAVQLDPQYAHAWALLSKTYSRLTAPLAFARGSLQEYRAKAQGNAQRAIRLNPSLYDAHAALALAYREAEQLALWRAEAQKAIEINPRVAEAYELFADSYMAAPAWGCQRDRNPARAEEYFRKAIEIDPRFGAAYANLVYHLHWLGRLDDSLRAADEGLATLPGSVVVRRARSTALLWLNRLSEAEQEVRALNVDEKNLTVQDEFVLGSVDLKRGNVETGRQRFASVLRALPVWELSIARSYFNVNDLADALAHLEHAIAMDASCAQYIETTPAFVAYRADPRFRAAIAGAGAR